MAVIYTYVIQFIIIRDRFSEAALASENDSKIGKGERAD